MKAQRELDSEGTLMTYRVGLDRINAVEARRLSNESRRALPMPPRPLPLPPGAR
jgi:hypothetical protein